MIVPKIRKKNFRCGHKGFGTFCHRCSMADELEQLLQKGKVYITHKKKNKSTGKTQPKKWTKKEMKAEIKRLRDEDKAFLPV